MIKHAHLQDIGLKGLRFCDALRWHDDELWFSDLLGRHIYHYNPATGQLNRIAYIAGQPSGLGHMSDGTLVAASMLDRLILRWIEGKPTIFRDLSSICTSPLNDLLVDEHDRIYVGSFGFQPAYDDPRNAQPSNLYLIKNIDDDTIPYVSVVAEDLLFPNGMVMTHGGTRLVVAETFANRITRFDVHSDGSLSHRTVLCDLGDRAPDGLCATTDDSVWVGCPFSEEFLKISANGKMLEVVKTEGRWAVSPVIGGTNQDLLFLATAATSLHDYHNGVSRANIATMTLSSIDSRRIHHD